MPLQFSSLLMLFFSTSLYFSAISSAQAQSNALSVDDFLAAPDMLTASISPDGKYIASVWNLDGKRTVLIYDIAQSKVITRFGDNIIRPYGVAWANENRILVKLLVPYETDKVRRESESSDDFDIDDYFMFGRMISANIDGEDVVSLMNDERNVKRNVNLASVTHYLPDDPDHILMSAVRRERLTLFKVNVNTGESERIITGGRFTSAFVNDKQGNLLFRYDYKRIAKTIEIFRFKSEDEWESVDIVYFDEDEEDKNKVDYRDLVGVKDGQLVYRKLNEETGFHELIMVKEDTREILVSLPSIDIVGVITTGIDNEVIGYTTLTDVYRSRFFDEERQTIYDAAAKNFKDENFSFFNVASNKSFAIVRSWGSTNPVTYFTYDMQNDKMTRLNYPYSSLPPQRLAAGFKLQYPTRDKKLITGYIYLPPEFDGSKALPLVMMPHGGPQVRNSLNYSDLTQYVATRGYIVFKPNFRGSSGYGKAFEEEGYREWGGKMQEDLEDAVAFLVKEGLVRKGKVCIVGASYGGYAALMGTVKTPDMYACAASINGVSHLPEQIEYDLDKFDSEKLITFIKKSVGDPNIDADMLQARSPALHADKIKTPILLIHGDEDERVPYEQSELMYKALKKHNKEVEFITLEETGHAAFVYEEDIRVIYTALEKFLGSALLTED